MHLAPPLLYVLTAKDESQGGIGYLKGPVARVRTAEGRFSPSWAGP